MLRRVSLDPVPAAGQWAHPCTGAVSPQSSRPLSQRHTGLSPRPSTILAHLTPRASKTRIRRLELASFLQPSLPAHPLCSHSSIKLVDQKNGTDLDPNNLKYRPREQGGGGGGVRSALCLLGATWGFALMPCL